MTTYMPARWHGSAVNLPITRIVIHGTVSPCRAGQARATALFFAHETNQTSAHYVVDPGEVVRCVPDNTVAYGAPPNQHSLHVELCDPQTGSGKRWSDEPHRQMLARAAVLVAGLCKTYGVPASKVTSAMLTDGQHGICGHVDVTNAWHKTTHTDPGPDFPWADFIRAVQSALNPVPAATPAKDGTAMPTSKTSGNYHPAEPVTLTGEWQTLDVAAPAKDGRQVTFAKGPMTVGGDWTTYVTGSGVIQTRPVIVERKTAKGPFVVVNTAGTDVGEGTRPVTVTLKAGQRLRMQARLASGAAQVTSVSWRLNQWSTK